MERGPVNHDLQKGLKDLPTTYQSSISLSISAGMQSDVDVSQYGVYQIQCERFLPFLISLSAISHCVAPFVCLFCAFSIVTSTKGNPLVVCLLSGCLELFFLLCTPRWLSVGYSCVWLVFCCAVGCASWSSDELDSYFYRCAVLSQVLRAEFLSFLSLVWSS